MCCVYFGLFSSCVLVYPKLQVFLDCSFLIVPLIFFYSLIDNILIEVPVPNQENERSCIGVLGVSILASFYDSDIWFCNCSDRVVCFYFILKLDRWYQITNVLLLPFAISQTYLHSGIFNSSLKNFISFNEYPPFVDSPNLAHVSISIIIIGSPLPLWLIRSPHDMVTYTTWGKI